MIKVLTLRKVKTLTQIRLLLATVALFMLPRVGQAQYFMSEHLQHKVLKSSGRDSVILLSATPFSVPKMNDTLPLVYHEPMPDSIMPRSAVVIGTIEIQAELLEDVVPNLEKYARQLGADWIVSFQEPRALLTKDKWKVYRSRALLLRVLDPQFINQSDIAYAYYEQQSLSNYAAVDHWFDQFGKGYGEKLDQPEQIGPSEMDQLNPDREAAK